jgi:hypothetical protein
VTVDPGALPSTAVALGRTKLLETRSAGLRIAHRPDLAPGLVLEAIERHCENVAQGMTACEHLGSVSSVSRVRVGEGSRALDVAVKWNHWRGLRGVVSDFLRGSRARRGVAGADRLARLGMCGPETIAFAERRRLGFVVESFLFTQFVVGSAPIPAAMPEIRKDPKRRRALAFQLGDVIGRLHAAGADHADLKHSNILVTSDDRLVLLDLDTLVPPHRLRWRHRVRALGQLEAFAVDLYPGLPRTDRARFLKRYFAHNPELGPRRRELVDAVRRWVERRLAHWARSERGLLQFPLAPRSPASAAAPAEAHPPAGSDRS